MPHVTRSWMSQRAQRGRLAGKGKRPAPAVLAEAAARCGQCWLTWVPGKKWGPCRGDCLSPQPPRDFLSLFLSLGNRATHQQCCHHLPVTPALPVPSARMRAPRGSQRLPACLPACLSLPLSSRFSLLLLLPLSCPIGLSRYFCVSFFSPSDSGSPLFTFETDTVTP